MRMLTSVLLAVVLLVAGCGSTPRECPRCPVLESENAALRRDADRLRADIDAQRRETDAIRRELDVLRSSARADAGSAPYVAPPAAPPPTRGALVAPTPPTPRATTPPSQDSERRATSVQCSGTTQKGAQCKRMTKSANGLCYQHGGN